VFDAGPRLVSFVFIDSDVPDVDNDSFSHRCHGLWTNIEVTPTQQHIPLGSHKQADTTVIPWMPPHAQKGSPYHRISAFMLEHTDGKALDVEALKASTPQNGFNLRTFLSKYPLKPVGVNMFRTVYDEGTKMVMEEHGLDGADVELRRKPSEKLPYKKKDGARYRGFKK
jgi:large subunit ribosomal protein L35